MKASLGLLIMITFILGGCTTYSKNVKKLSHGLSKQQVVELWGNPQQKTAMGFSRENHPVELWFYSQKAASSRHGHEYVLIFVDSELYRWFVDNPKGVFNTLAALGVIKKKNAELGLEEYQRSLQNSVNQAIQTQKLMELINSYKMNEVTQRNIQTMQQMQTIRQQQIHPVAPPPPPPRAPDPNRK